jgi:hypothetical protein
MLALCEEVSLPLSSFVPPYLRIETPHDPFDRPRDPNVAAIHPEQRLRVTVTV